MPSSSPTQTLMSHLSACRGLDVCVSARTHIARVRALGHVGSYFTPTPPCLQCTAGTTPPDIPLNAACVCVRARVYVTTTSPFHTHPTKSQPHVLICRDPCRIAVMDGPSSQIVSRSIRPSCRATEHGACYSVRSGSMNFGSRTVTRDSDEEEGTEN